MSAPLRQQTHTVQRDSEATLAQRRAADPARSVWVGASAGSGKTKVLTDRLLRLLLPRESGEPGTLPARILCLTYTTVGAREMALRLNARLAGWAAMDEPALTDDLAALLGREPRETDRKAARRLFASVIDAPGGLRIQTIHSFCQSILGRFPLEAELPPTFTALDETQGAALRDAARNETLAAAAGAPETPLGAALHLLTPQVALDDLTAMLGFVLKEYRQLEHRIHEADFGAWLQDGLAAAFELRAGETDEVAILRAAFTAGTFDEALIRDAAAIMLADGGKTVTKLGSGIADWLALDGARRLAGWQRYARSFLTTGGEPFKKFMTKDLAAAHPAHDQALRAEAERMVELQDRVRAAQTAGLTHALLLLGVEVWRRYTEAKAARGALDFDDLINRTLDLLGRPGIAPWVMFKLDGGLDHLLIDEAQDTNPAQWEIVKRLTGDFFSGMGAREDVRRTVFAVGDEKQSIFGFQGARPERFYEARAYFSDIVRAPDAWWTERLRTSFRTVPSVLRFVDEVFAPDAMRAGVSDEEVRHETERRAHAGLVELWPLFVTQDKAAYDPFTPPVAKRESRSGAARLAEHIGDTIKGWIDNKEILESRGRAIAPGDILILVRSRTAFVGQIIRALKTRGVPVSGVDRMVLKEQLAVQDLLAAVQFALLPDDDLALACLLKSPLIGWDDARLEALALGRGEASLWARLSGSEDVDLRGWLDALIADAGRDRPFEFFSRLLEAPCPSDTTSGLHAMSARLGSEALDPLQEFLNAALAAERNDVPSLQTFIIAMQQGDSQIKREQEAAGTAVRIMTVHGAKGLEAPIVILPDTILSRRLDKPRLIWPDRSGLAVPVWSPRADLDSRVYRALYDRLDELQDAEYRRLLYVALTRAADRLYIAGHTGTQKRSDKFSCWYDDMAAAMARLAEAETLPFESNHYLPEPDAPPATLRRLHNPQSGDRLAAAKNKAETGGTGETLPLPHWLYTPPAPEREPSYPLTPSRPAAEPAALSPLQPSDPHRFRRGIVTHRLLQFLPDLPPDMWAAQALRFLDKQATDLPAETRASVAAETLAILGNPDWAQLFGPDSLAEISVTGQAGGRLVSGQVDRLYLSADAVWIVDYKTNRPPPATPVGIPAIYRAQMAAYRDVIAAIYPGRTVRCFLLWTDGPALMPVDFPV